MDIYGLGSHISYKGQIVKFLLCIKGLRDIASYSPYIILHLASIILGVRGLGI